MLDKLRKTITSILSHIEIQKEEITKEEIFDEPKITTKKKIPRNAICPLCDSGKKYKHCCGKF